MAHAATRKKKRRKRGDRVRGVQDWCMEKFKVFVRSDIDCDGGCFTLSRWNVRYEWAEWY